MQLSNIRKISWLMSAGLAWAGCTGPTGDPGPAGPGAAVFEVSGTVSDASGPVPALVPVFLVAIDDTGGTIGTYGGTFTDDAGAFSISVDDGVVPSARAMVVAGEGGEPLVASLSSGSGLRVDPISTGVLAAVLLITETPGGRSLRDFSAEEMANLYVQAQSALTGDGTDLSDRDAVLAGVIGSVGGAIADYSGGGIPTPARGFPEPQDVAEDDGLFTTELADGAGAVYQINDDSEIFDAAVGGQGRAFDSAFKLEVGGFAFNGQAKRVEDGDEVVNGPLPMAGLQVTRKVRPDPNRNLVRFTEILVNPTDADITVPVEMNYNLGADDTAQVLGTSSGDLVLDGDDQWVYLDDADLEGGSPVTAMWFGDTPTAAQAGAGFGDNVTATWESVTVPAGGRVTMIHFGLVAPDPPDAAALEELLASLPPRALDAYAGMTQADVEANMTYEPPELVAVVFAAEAGAVASYATVDIVNESTGASEQARAASDGSFRATVAGATGDVIRVTASDGTDEAITVP